MGRYAKHHPLPAHRLGQFADQVAPRAHASRAPFGKARIVHGKPIVMLRHRHHKARPRPLKQIGPRRRIVPFGPELGDEILVAEITMGPVRGQMMLELGRALLVHIPRIPLVAERRHRIYAPVDEYAEFAVQIPIRHPVATKRIPPRPKRPRRNPLLDPVQRHHYIRHRPLSPAFIVVPMPYDARLFTRFWLSSTIHLPPHPIVLTDPRLRPEMTRHGEIDTRSCLDSADDRLEDVCRAS